MPMSKVKKLLKIGDSYAVVLPKEFVDCGTIKEVMIEYNKDHLNIKHVSPSKMSKKELSLFGRYAGPKDSSTNRKKYLMESLSAKFSRH